MPRPGKHGVPRDDHRDVPRVFSPASCVIFSPSLSPQEPETDDSFNRQS